MWISKSDSLVYEEWDNILIVPIFSPDWSHFSGEIVRIPSQKITCRGFDDWLSHFPRVDEIQLVEDALQSLKKNPRRIHIHGLSCAESIALIRGYYRDRGYEDALAKNYILPLDEQLTVSLNLRHMLWCEKDKEFLCKKDVQDNPFYAVTPPLRSAHDLRALQQATRMGIIMGIEVYFGEESFLVQIFKREILSPFQLSQTIGFRSLQLTFPGDTRDIKIDLV